MRMRDNQENALSGRRSPGPAAHNSHKNRVNSYVKREEKRKENTDTACR